MKGKRRNPWPKRLLAICKRLELTHAEMADRLEIPVPTLRNWIYGRAEPGIAWVRIIAQTFPEKSSEKQLTGD